MVLGILPFLIQWIALSQFKFSRSPVLYQSTQTNYLPPKSHWTLLTELSQLSEDDIEDYIPQVCNVVLDREMLNNEDIFQYFENIVVNKCAECLPFGLRVCGSLKAMAPSPAEGLFKNVLLSYSSAQLASLKEQRFNAFQNNVLLATCHGHSKQSSAEAHTLRSLYFKDYRFMLDSLGRLGLELRSYPVAHRNSHLKNAIAQHNAILFSRMVAMSRASGASSQSHHQSQQQHQQHFPYGAESERDHPFEGIYNGVCAEDVAAQCPEIVRNSLHLPLLRSQDKIRRIVRFVEAECEVLPSKDRCPYLVVVETLEDNASVRCGDAALYTHYKGPTSSGAAHTDNGEHVVHRANHVEWFGTAALSDVRGGEVPSIPPLRAIGTSRRFRRPPSFALPSRVAAKDSKHASTTDVSLSEGVVVEDHHEEAAVQKGASAPELDATDEQFYDHGSASSGDTISGDKISGDTMSGESVVDGEEEVVLEVPDRHLSLYDGNVVRDSGDVSDNWVNGRGVRTISPHTSALQSSQPPLSAVYSGIGLVRPKTHLERKALLRSSSPFGHLPGWDVSSFIVKSGDDLGKEALAMQLISLMQDIFRQEGLDIFLRPYQILATGHQTGLIEYLEGTMSVDRIKKSAGPGFSVSLREYFEHCFGPAYSPVHAKAAENFVKSLAGYSLVTYVLQVRDRHNANILVDSDGHLIHIDFGFILGDSPGFNLNFESAPFKLTREYLEVMGGVDSAAFRQFEDLFLRGFSALQRHTEAFSAIVQLFYGDKRKGAAESLCSRLLFPSSQEDVVGLVRESLDNWRTKQYDWYQQQSNNIHM